jgi:hypothetical protein
MIPDENPRGLVEDLPLEDVDMEASDRALDNIPPELRARLWAMGVSLPPYEGHPDTRGTDDSRV